jgi:hypothetical protein
MPPRNPITKCAHCGGSVLKHNTEDGVVLKCLSCNREAGAKPVPLPLTTPEPVVGNAGIYDQDQKAG